MKPLLGLAALVLLLGAGTLPAAARGSYVIDNAGLLSANAIAQINAKVGTFNAQTGKEVVVDTEPTVNGGTPVQAAEAIFASQQINGVLIYIAKSPKTIGVLPGRAASQYFPAGSTASIRQAIASEFNQGNYDAGVTLGVDLTLNTYASHMGTLKKTTYAPVGSTAERAQVGGGFSMGWIWWLIVLAVIFFIVRGIFRAMTGPRMMGGPMGGGPGYGPGPYGGGGYGPGYGGGFGGGGGSFFSGLLGGLGGAWLGNELFRGGGQNIVGDASQQAGFGGAGGAGGGGDASGWQSDPGQADPGNSSFGGWGDSGGGGGWGDVGGGGGFGGDSGGGW